MDRRRAAGALLALAACIACSTAAPTASNQTALELLEGPSEGCYYNFQHYGEGDRIMTNEPCLNCTCHNRMLMCYLRVCPFTKAIGQDCTIEKRADQCCPIVTCPDVPVDLLTSTSTTSPAEYGATGLGKVDKYGCSINGKYFPEGSKVPPTPNKPCEHCYCIRNMTTCVMQECTLHVDGCTPIYHKDVCCPVRYSCDHQDDEMLLLDDMTTTVRPTPGFLLTTTTMASVTQLSQDCVHDDQVFADGALIKTEKACEHCYCMKGDIVCVVQECGTPMENEGKNCTSLPPRQGQCCPDTYICEGDEVFTDVTTAVTYEELTTFSPPRRVEGSGYRNEPDEPYTEIPTFEGSGDEHATTLDASDMFTSPKQTPQIIDEVFAATEESLKPSLSTIEPDKGQNTVPDDSDESTSSDLKEKLTTEQQVFATTQPTVVDEIKDSLELKTTISDYHSPTVSDSITSKVHELTVTTESVASYTNIDSKTTEIDTESTETPNAIAELSTQQTFSGTSTDASALYEQKDKITTLQSPDLSKIDESYQTKITTTEIPKDDSEYNEDTKQDSSLTHDKEDTGALVTTISIEPSETTSVNPIENEINEDILPPGRIPGEGDCLLNGISYKNNTNVPNINNCHSSCKCISSIVKCDPIICSPPPEHMDNMNDCQPIYDTPDACCPTYVCHSRETIPPESHSQMSGTESPKLSPENSESECNGAQCEPYDSKPMSVEPCSGENCKPKTEDQDKKCTTGSCDQSESSINTSPPVIHSEECVGNTCQPSEEICKDGKCQEPNISETICDKENGCQLSEVCEGNKCVFESQATVPTDEISSTLEQNESNLPSKCTEESCRRKEHPKEEHKTPLECSGSNCAPDKVVKDESSILSTERPIRDEIYKESTTEKIADDYSKAQEAEQTPTEETHKATYHETTVTEYQEIPSELSTDKSKGTSFSDVMDQITEKGVSYTETTELNTKEIEETSTEILDKSKPENHTTTISDSPKYQEHETESIKQITKETLTESPIVTQYEEHSTESPKEDIRGTDKLTEPTTSFMESTETIGIKSPEQETNKDITDIINVEEYTKSQETTTTPSQILKTTQKQLEEDEVKEMYTESPEEYTTSRDEAVPTDKQEPIKTETQESVDTESMLDISMTESSVTFVPETSTKKHIDDKIQEDKIEQPNTTEQSIFVEPSTEPYEIKLQETASDKIYDHTEKEHVSTESPVTFTEILPIETTAHELYKIEEKPEPSQTTEMEALPVEIDTGKESTELPFEDQQKHSQSPDSITEKQDIYTTSAESQESITSQVYTTQPSATEKIFETQTQESPISEKDELPESPMTISPPEHDMKEISTKQPESILEETTTILNIKEDHTDTYVKDVIEKTTKHPEQTFQEDKTYTESSETEPQEMTTSGVQIEELEMTPEAKPDEPTGFETTISSVTTDENKELGFEKEHSGETTLLAEVHSTKLDEPVTIPIKTQNITPTTTISSRDQDEIYKTESSKQSYEEKVDTPNYVQPDHQTQEPSINEYPSKENTEAPDSYVNTIPVSIDDTKLDETPLYSTPEPITQYTDKEDSTLSEDHITKEFDSLTTVTDSTKKAEIPTQSTTSPKLVTEGQTDIEQWTTQQTPKKEKEQTESPMSLVTGATESLLVEEGTRDSILDKTTHEPDANIPNVEKIKKPDSDEAKPQIISTESPVTETEIKITSEISPQMYPEKESRPGTLLTSPAPEHTTIEVFDISTEVGEKLAPTTEKQDGMTITQYPIKTDSESSPIDVLYESTSIPPVETSSEKIFVQGEQEMTTKQPEILVSMTTATFDQETYSKPHDVLVKEVTEQPQYNKDLTTTEILKDIDEDNQQQEHTILPELLTTKHIETLDNNQDAHKQSEDENTIAPEQSITTEKVIIMEQTVPHDIEIQGTVTNVPSISEEKGVTTSMYQDLTTLKEETHLSSLPTSGTTSIVTTESSETSLSEEDHRRTLSPGLETLRPDEKISEQHRTTQTPETLSTASIDHTEINQELTSKRPESETTTNIDSNKELEQVTAMPQDTEGDNVIQTETAPQAHEYPMVTESTGEHITTVRDDTTKPETDTGANKEEQITENIPDSDTFSSKMPVDTKEVASEHTVLQESQTESYIPKVTDISGLKETVPSETGIMETGTSIPEATEPPIIYKVTESPPYKETDITVPKVTESSLPETTKVSISEVTEVRGSEETEVSASDVTTAPVHEVTDVFVPKVTKDSAPKVSEGSALGEIDGNIPEATEVSLPEVTEAYVNKISEVSTPEDIEVAVTEVTESSVSKLTEGSVDEVTSQKSEESMPDATEASTPQIIEASIPEETETTAHDISESSSAVITEPSIPDATKEVTFADVTEPSKETESEYVNKVFESTTSKVKDEIPKIPEQSATLVSIQTSSETTPYLVELQEHTTKGDEDISLATVSEQDATKRPETYEHERGDQPLGNLPDTSTQGELQEEYTTKQSILPQEQSSEYPQESSDKPEITVEVSKSSESPMSTLSDSIEHHTVLPGEEAATLTPTTSLTVKEHEKLTTDTAAMETTTYKKDILLDTEKITEHEIMHEITTIESELMPAITKATTIKMPDITTSLPSQLDDTFTKPADKPIESYSSTTPEELPKPGINEIQPTEELPSPDFPPSGTSGYGQEPDYVEEDQAFGPGTCRYGGKVYVSAQQIPRDDPCDFCFCFRSDIICLQQSCPPPIHGCHEEPIQGFCCPRYECPVSMATTLNVTTTTTTTTTTLPPHFLPHAYKGAAQRRGCQIKGHSYKVGEVVRASSGPCLHCTCGGDGQMKCDPKACTPEPMLRQMIAAAVSAKRRR